MNQDEGIQDSQPHLTNDRGGPKRVLFDGLKETLERLVNGDSTAKLEVGL